MAASWTLRLLAAGVCFAWMTSPLNALIFCPVCDGEGCPYISTTSTPRPDPGQVFAGPNGVTSITMYKNPPGGGPYYFNWYVGLPGALLHPLGPPCPICVILATMMTTAALQACKPPSHLAWPGLTPPHPPSRITSTGSSFGGSRTQAARQSPVPWSLSPTSPTLARPPSSTTVTPSLAA